jgi:hypothetical protein
VWSNGKALAMHVKNINRMEKKMKQPKFKFGDRLLRQCTKTTFIVSRIEKVNSRFFDEYAYYGEGNVNGSMESVVEPYKEPEKKKLYAYRLRGNLQEVRFFGIDLDGEIGDVNNLTRAKEYDIEY